jgi:predicted nucleic acid-binding protein
VKRRVAVDSGPLVALFDPSDFYHEGAVAFFADRTVRGFITTAVIAEVTHLLEFRDDTPINFLRWLRRDAFAVEDVASDLERIIELMTKYADVPMDFADATVVAASERLGIRDVATLDSHFLIYRLHGRQIFQNHFPR